ncbi:MAG: hypothetical protein DDT20_01177 [Firmicutes bacterium]|nr:hypothetical protein [Bacillota bacterium]
MDVRQRTSLWSWCQREELEPWVIRIREEAAQDGQGAIQVLREPQAGSLMMRATDSATGGVFNLGEVLISDCMVAVLGHKGYGLVLGYEPWRAEAAAMLDAVFRAPEEKWASFRAAMQPWLEAQVTLRQTEDRRKFERIARTKVDFQGMCSERESKDYE